jgi:hypothetical protein
LRMVLKFCCWTGDSRFKLRLLVNENFQVRTLQSQVDFLIRIEFCGLLLRSLQKDVWETWRI